MNGDTLTELEANGYLVLDEEQAEKLTELLISLRIVALRDNYQHYANEVTKFLKEVGCE